jgi:hypothetical protein
VTQDSTNAFTPNVCPGAEASCTRKQPASTVQPRKQPASTVQPRRRMVVRRGFVGKGCYVGYEDSKMHRHYLRARPAGPESTGHWHAATAPPHRGEPTDTAHIRTHSTTRTDSHSGRRRSTLARRSALGSSGWGVVVGPVGTRPNHTLLSLCTQVCTWTLVRAGGADEPPSPYHLHIGTLVIGCRFHVSMTSHSFGPVPRVIAKRGGGCSACQDQGVTRGCRSEDTP